MVCIDAYVSVLRCIIGIIMCVINIQRKRESVLPNVFPLGWKLKSDIPIWTEGRCTFSPTLPNNTPVASSASHPPDPVTDKTELQTNSVGTVHRTETWNETFCKLPRNTIASAARYSWCFSNVSYSFYPDHLSLSLFCTLLLSTSLTDDLQCVCCLLCDQWN